DKNRLMTAADARHQGEALTRQGDHLAASEWFDLAKTLKEGSGDHWARIFGEDVEAVLPGGKRVKITYKGTTDSYALNQAKLTPEEKIEVQQQRDANLQAQMDQIRGRIDENSTP